MKDKKLLVLIMAMVFALCMAALAGCSGSSGSSSSASSEPAPTDEELITQDCEKVIGTYISKEELLTSLQEDAEIQDLVAIGFDIDAYAENMSKIFKFAVDSVEVDGDTAVAKCSLTVPSFGEKMEAMLTEAVTAATEGVDISAMSEEEQMALLMTAMNQVMSSPDFPSETTNFDIDYVKDGDTWTMKNAEDIESTLNELGNAASGLQ